MCRSVSTTWWGLLSGQDKITCVVFCLICFVCWLIFPIYSDSFPFCWSCFCRPSLVRDSRSTTSSADKRHLSSEYMKAIPAKDGSSSASLSHHLLCVFVAVDICWCSWTWWYHRVCHLSRISTVQTADSQQYRQIICSRLWVRVLGWTLVCCMVVWKEASLWFAQDVV